MVVKQSQSSKEQALFSPTQLSALAGYQRFGDYLRLKRNQLGLLQREMAECFSLTPSMYGFLERERRAPQVDELIPMFAALVQLQNDKHLPPIQIIEAVTFFRLGRAAIEKKGKKRPNVTQQEWDEIEQQLINLVDHRQRLQLHLVSGNGNNASLILESADSRRRKTLKDMLKTDLSHLLEREVWVQRVLTYPDRTPQIKVSVIQAGVGAGKSHALALLTQRLAERDDLFLIPYQFKHSETMTTEDHLHEFLATLYADLTMRVTDEVRRLPLAERIDQVLGAIRVCNQKVIVLVDDAQEMFPSTNEWSNSWHQFFRAFLDEPHTATLYMMTRVWPGWDERKRSFLEEENLPDLSIEAGIQLWKRHGFDDVEDNLLRKVCERCGQNPQAIEMLAFQYKRRGFSIDWTGSFRSTDKNPHTASLKKLLESDALFSGHLDDVSRKTLQQVFSSRLSGEDLRLLECLALSPLGIPFDIVADRFEFAAQSYEQLVKASFADLSMAASGRAAVVPLVREAMLQSLTAQHKQEVEQLVTEIYACWLEDVQDFRDDAEKAALIAEMIVRYIRQRHLLKAAELFVSFGWLSTLFGHTTRIQRVFDAMVKADRRREESVEHEVGRLILQHHIGLKTGQKITAAERDQIYQYIYTKVLADEVTLQAFTTLDVLHNLLIIYLRESLFTRASEILDETFSRLQRNGQLTSEIYASYLDNKARLFARWWEKIEEQDYNHDEVQRLQQECIATLRESIAQWRHCLRNALPLQTHYVHFKMARTLNDYAYRQRLVGNLVEAREAIEESLRLKKAGGALPHSLAISLSEFSQILALQGGIRQALACNGEAISIVEGLINDGDTSHSSELGVFLIERADILRMQAHLDEAKTLLERAITFVGNKPSRQHFRVKAERDIEGISFLLETKQNRQLDKHWFSRYLDLASYGGLAWFAHAGPFTDDEQQEWEHLLPRQEEEEASARMTALIMQSRQREFVRSQEEKRVPKLWYPLIPLEKVQRLIKQFKQLQEEIKKQETNAIVRSLYTDAIDEQIVVLRQCEATALGDQRTVWDCNLYLYGKPSAREVFIALQSLCEMALEAQNYERTAEIAQAVLHQVKDWGLSPLDIAAMEFFASKQETVPSFKPKLASDKDKKFSHIAVRQFFQDVFDEYHAYSWKVEIAPARDGAYIDADLQTLFLPSKPLSLDKIRDLLAEEVETHAYRSLSGQQSPLALLGSGLARYSATEEGLANHYIQQVSLHIYGSEKSKSWIGTLATGLASGVLTPALSFYELAAFLEKMFLISKLLSSKSITWSEAIANAKQQAWSRAARTFRGMPNLEEVGCCSLKDVIYLRGYLAVKQALEQVEEQRLFVGKIGIEHLDAMAELDIVAPYTPHRHLALAPDLFDRLSQYKG